MTDKSRRKFIKQIAACCGATALAPGASPFSPGLSFAASCTSGANARKVVVSIFLSGGPDGKSILVPTASQAYLDKHPVLKVTNSLSLNAAHGLHPSLARLKVQYDAGHVAIMMGAGYPNHSRSHENSTDIMGRGIVTYSGSVSGWAGRFASAYCESSEAFSMFSFRGNIDEIRGAPFNAPTGSRLSSFRYESTFDAQNDAFINLVSRANRNGASLDNPQANGMYNAWSGGEAAADVISQVTAVYPVTAGPVYPTTDIGRKLADSARLINAGPLAPVRHIFLSQGGYDTHGDQVTALPRLLSELDAGIDAFWSDMIRLGRADDVVVVAYGEFGRTNENSTAGTDHGQGGICIVLGNNVRGGVHSPAYQDTDFTRRDPWVPVKFDYREVLEQIFARHQGADPSVIFPEWYNKIGLNLFT